MCLVCLVCLTSYFHTRDDTFDQFPSDRLRTISDGQMQAKTNLVKMSNVFTLDFSRNILGTNSQAVQTKTHMFD